ncbi:MAG: COX15/CtaA family protein [Chitinophagaceae bacterium]|nr:COX15/CtaA family protein [Chitinophagaceae bacterium]
MDDRLKQKRIAFWLLTGVGMLMVQVLLGGITRLTGSGLSMTEWKPIMGFIPPTSDAEWHLAFEKYKEIGQFKYLNQDFSLSNFKFIFFWEWFHRFWARFIAVVFVIPFIYFLVKRYFTFETIKILLLLFGMGAAQGAIGWIMVLSGLNDEALYVSHFKLALHFISAMVLIAFTYWFALRLWLSDSVRVYQPKLRKLTAWLLVLISVQLVYGAFMAGLKAGTMAPTWPSINGDYFPEALSKHSLFSHGMNIHFIHRNLAYLLTILSLLWTIKAFKLSQVGAWNRWKWVPLALVCMQVLLGILTVLHASKIARNSFGAFEYLAQAHQLVAMLLAMSFVWAIFILRSEKGLTQTSSTH